MPELIAAEVGGLAGIAVIDRGEGQPRVDGDRARPQAQVEHPGAVGDPGARRRRADEGVEVEHPAVTLEARATTKLLQRGIERVLLAVGPLNQGSVVAGAAVAVVIQRAVRVRCPGVNREARGAEQEVVAEMAVLPVLRAEEALATSPSPLLAYVEAGKLALAAYRAQEAVGKAAEEVASLHEVGRLQVTANEAAVAVSKACAAIIAKEEGDAVSG